TVDSPMVDSGGSWRRGRRTSSRDCTRCSDERDTAARTSGHKAMVSGRGTTEVFMLRLDSDLTSRLLQHKASVDELYSTYGFLPAFRYRYDLLVTGDTFSSRFDSPPNARIHSLPDIWQFRKDLWNRSYNLSQQLDELGFDDNLYRKGGVRSSWDPLTGARNNKPTCNRNKSRRSNMITDLHPDPNLHPARTKYR
ncbi:hypothetical protein VP01_55g1, partial [Puccinia sorghi]